MKGRNEAKGALTALVEQVEDWRAQRGGLRTRVPAELWKAAVGVARVEGVNATSKAIKFSYYGLKDRVVAAERTARSARKNTSRSEARFVEVQMPPPTLVPSWPRESPTLRSSSSGGQTSVELVGTGGARMRIDVSGTSGVDVVGLAQAFWSRAR